MTDSEKLARIRWLAESWRAVPDYDVTSAEDPRQPSDMDVAYDDAAMQILAVLDAMAETVGLADGRSVPLAAVKALDELEQKWPGATLPQARSAIVAAVIAALDDATRLLAGKAIWAVAEWMEVHSGGESYEIYRDPDGSGGGYRFTVERIEA